MKNIHNKFIKYKYIYNKIQNEYKVFIFNIYIYNNNNNNKVTIGSLFI